VALLLFNNISNIVFNAIRISILAVVSYSSSVALPATMATGNSNVFFAIALCTQSPYAEVFVHHTSLPLGSLILIGCVLVADYPVDIRYRLLVLLLFEIFGMSGTSSYDLGSLVEPRPCRPLSFPLLLPPVLCQSIGNITLLEIYLLGRTGIIEPRESEIVHLIRWMTNSEICHLVDGRRSFVDFFQEFYI
jgi:hypothetical protein